MNWLVFHIVSGHSFFTGIAFLLFAGVLCWSQGRVFKRFAGLAFVLGLILIAVSSTAIPYICYAVAGSVTVAWIICQFLNKFSTFATTAFMAVWVIAALIEIPYHITPKVSPVQNRTVAIIGDSVTAGVGGNSEKETWPKIIARLHNLDVLDFSHVGETAGSALERLGQHQFDASIVIVEIGGNDLLGSTSAEQFAKDLDSLLTLVSRSDRQVVMFELPLPPFCHEYGRIQRQLTKKHGVKLIPKRIFLSVIAGSGSTLDTIHLSQSGHNRMAEIVWQLIESAFEK